MNSPAKIRTLVITFFEKNQKTGRVEEIISHGVDLATGNNVPMEPVTVQMAGYLGKDPDLGWFVQEA